MTEKKQFVKNKRNNNGNWFLKKRMEDIKDVIDSLGLDIQIYGSLEFPVFVMNDKFKLPIAIRSNIFNVYDKFDDGKVVFEFNLLDKRSVSLKNLADCMQNVELREIYKIKCGGLYFSKFDHSDNSRSAVFSNDKPKVIHTIEWANGIADKLRELAYDPEVV